MMNLHGCGMWMEKIKDVLRRLGRPLELFL